MDETVVVIGQNELFFLKIEAQAKRCGLECLKVDLNDDVPGGFLIWDIGGLSKSIFQSMRAKLLDNRSRVALVSSMDSELTSRLLGLDGEDGQIFSILTDLQEIISYSKGKSIVDGTRLLSSFKGDEDILEETVEMFSGQLERYSKELQDALDSEDSSKVSLISHTLKGICGNFCASELQANWSDIELTAREGRVDVKAIEVAIELSGRMLDEMRDLIKSNLGKIA